MESVKLKHVPVARFINFVAINEKEFIAAVTTSASIDKQDKLNGIIACTVISNKLTLLIPYPAIYLITDRCISYDSISKDISVFG